MFAQHPPDLARLQALVARLRAPDGCPWDREQELGDLRAYLLEEAHEVAAAIDLALQDGDFEPLAEELGDLLFQAAFIAQLASEAGAFELAQVIEGIHAKMVARHPHVFGDETLADAGAVRRAWERRKIAAKPRGESLLSGVPTALPALVAAYRLTQKAAGVDFDWPDVGGALAKVREELAELEDALDARTAATSDGGNEAENSREKNAGEAVREELGDLLFAVANVARKLDFDPELALAWSNRKFRRRFRAVEAELARRGRPLEEAGLEELDAIWEIVKQRE